MALPTLPAAVGPDAVSPLAHSCMHALTCSVSLTEERENRARRGTGKGLGMHYVEPVQGRALLWHFSDFSLLASAFSGPPSKMGAECEGRFPRPGHMFSGITENLKSFPGSLLLSVYHPKHVV